MESSKSSLLLAAAIVVAALVAALRTQRPPVAPVANDAPTATEPANFSNEGPQADELPLNHPPIEGTGTPNGMPETDGPPAIVWKVPSRWSVGPNPNTMRLATYHVPAAAGAADEAEATVTRAGGSTEANVQRWIGQFADAGPD